MKLRLKMKKIYCLLLVLYIGNFVNAQILTIPQPLKSYLLGAPSAFIESSYSYPATSFNTIDANGNGEIEASEAALVQYISINKYANSITSLDGLEQFVNLKELVIGTPITTFNGASFPNLKSLKFGYNYSSQIWGVISSLNLTGMTNLEVFTSTNFYSLQSLNFSGLSNLKKIVLTTDVDSSAHEITSINFTGLTNLEFLSLPNHTVLSAIDFTQMLNLKYLSLACQVPVLDITPLVHLETFIAGGIYNLTAIIHNQLPNLKNFTCSYYCPLTSLNLQGMPLLETINCSRNGNLSSIVFDANGYSNLVSLDCSSNQLQALNLSSCPNLQMLNCNNNQIVSLNLDTLTNLQRLDCGTNQITSLNLNGLSNLKTLDCSSNKITSLSMNGLASFQSFSCNSNPFLTTVDLSQLPSLDYFQCNYNPLLTSLNVSGLSILKIMTCTFNKLTALDVTGVPLLQQLYCYNNQLTALTYGGFTQDQNLYKIYCFNNQLTALNAALPSLSDFVGSNNRFTTLDFQASRVLRQLVCSNNLLTSLYVKNNFLESNLVFNDNPNLSYICTDAGQVTQVQNLVNSYGYTNCTVVSDCFVLSSPSFEVSNSFVLYPNPATNELRIETATDVLISAATVSNVVGQTVWSVSNPKGISTVDVTSLSPGTYFIRIDSNQGMVNKKFVKQ